VAPDRGYCRICVIIQHFAKVLQRAAELWPKTTFYNMASWI